MIETDLLSCTVGGLKDKLPAVSFLAREILSFFDRHRDPFVKSTRQVSDKHR